jgi:hypothetical protein
VKSGPYVILGIGLAGCLALAWMAEHLQPHVRSARAGGQLAAPAGYDAELAMPMAIQDEHEGDVVRRVVTARAVRGVDCQGLATRLARDVQAAARRNGASVAVRAVVRDADGNRPAVVELPPSPPAAPR